MPLFGSRRNGRINFSLEGRSQLNTAVIAPFVFDMCVFMIYTSLLCGHNLHIISEQSRQSGQDIIRFLNRCHIDMILKAVNVNIWDDIIESKVSAHVDGKIMAKGTILVTEKKKVKK